SGQACLLARRLVEAGVPWVTVMFNRSNRGQDKDPDLTEVYGWDTHNDIFEALKVHLLPRFDQTVSALLLDLHERGLLDTTLVVCMGEFGRAPRVALERNFAGSTPGRKHWAMVYSIVLAGAGVARGAVVGASDRNGAYPSTTPVGPGDVAATMFSALGIEPDGYYTDLSGRPYQIAEGRPIASLYRCAGRGRALHHAGQRPKPLDRPNHRQRSRGFLRARLWRLVWSTKCRTCWRK